MMKKPKGSSKYYCEFEFSPNNYKSSEIFVGVGRKYKNKNNHGYHNEQTFYMWLFDGKIRVNNVWNEYSSKVFPGSKVTVCLDMNAGALEFLIND